MKKNLYPLWSLLLSACLWPMLEVLAAVISLLPKSLQVGGLPGLVIVYVFYFTVFYLLNKRYFSTEKISGVKQAIVLHFQRSYGMYLLLFLIPFFYHIFFNACANAQEWCTDVFGVMIGLVFFTSILTNLFYLLSKTITQNTLLLYISVGLPVFLIIWLCWAPSIEYLFPFYFSLGYPLQLMWRGLLPL